MKKNTKSGIHKDVFLSKHELDDKKRLHDLLVAKECVNLILLRDMLCEYQNVDYYIERDFEIENMSKWGSNSNKNSKIKISVKLKL